MNAREEARQRLQHMENQMARLKEVEETGDSRTTEQLRIDLHRVTGQRDRLLAVLDHIATTIAEHDVGRMADWCGRVARDALAVNRDNPAYDEEPYMGHDGSKAERFPNPDLH